MSADAAGARPGGSVYLVRHGQTTLNAEGRLRGHLDPPLDEFGLHQAETLGAAFAALPRRPHRVVAGPLLRTQQTAAAIAGALGLEVLTDELLIDRDYGPWAGELTSDVRARFGHGMSDLPGAEPATEVAIRAVAALDAQVPYLDEPVVLVGHDAVNSNLLARIDEGLGPSEAIEQATACWNLLERRGTRWHVVVVNAAAEALRDT